MHLHHQTFVVSFVRDVEKHPLLQRGVGFAAVRARLCLLILLQSIVTTTHVQMQRRIDVFSCSVEDRSDSTETESHQA